MDGLFGSLLVTVNVPAKLPFVFGMKSILRAHVPPACSELEHVLLTMLYCPVIPILLMLSVALPLLLSTSV